MKIIRLLCALILPWTYAYAESVDVMELGIYHQQKAQSQPILAYPLLPDPMLFYKTSKTVFTTIDKGDHAKLFQRIRDRGGFAPIWTGVWQQAQLPHLEIIKTPSITLWIETLHTTPRTLAFYLIENDRMLSRITHRVQYHKPIYIDHPNYAMVLVMSKKDVEDQSMNDDERIAAEPKANRMIQASDKDDTLT